MSGRSTLSWMMSFASSSAAMSSKEMFGFRSITSRSSIWIRCASGPSPPGYTCCRNSELAGLPLPGFSGFSTRQGFSYSRRLSFAASLGGRFFCVWIGGGWLSLTRFMSFFGDTVSQRGELETEGRSECSGLPCHALPGCASSGGL